MRILFTSDVHGDMDVYRAFADRLKGFDLGILGGDLMEEFLPLEDAILYGLKDGDLVEELHGEGYDEVAELDKAIHSALHDRASMNRRGLELKRKDIVSILEKARKPIYFVRGNHDIADWPDTKYLVSIEDRKIALGEISLLGLKDQFRQAVSTWRYSERLARQVDRSTILVCHSPPYRVMDLTRMVDRRSHRVVLRHVGSRKILKLINKRHPLFCLCGHVHEGMGIQGNIINGGCYRQGKFVAIDTASRQVDFLGW